MTKAWDDYKEAIIVEYKDNNKPLHEVQRIMEERHRFKASTRAYRSRLDKWGVHKYSCRKRNGSVSMNDDGSHDEEAPVLSPPRTPGQAHTSPMTDPEPTTPGPMSPISPISPHDPHYYGAGSMCGTASPTGMGSPYQHPFGPLQHRHSMPSGLPAPGYMHDARFRHSSFSHMQQQPQYDFWRSNTQMNGYQQHPHPIQGPGSMNTISASIPSSSNHGRYAHSHWDDEIKSAPPE